jgi:hypothetical protein
MSDIENVPNTVKLNLERFNNTFMELMTNLVNTCPIESSELTQTDYMHESVLNKKPNTYFNDFILLNFKNVNLYSNLSGDAKSNITKDTENIELLKGVDLNDILMADSMQVFNNFNMLRKYLFTLFALSFSLDGINDYIKNTFPEKSEQLLEVTQNSKTYIGTFISSFKADKKRTENATKATTSSKTGDNTGHTDNNNDNNNDNNDNNDNTDNLNFEGDEYKNSEIVKLAKEISSELDPNDLKDLQNPQDIFSSLLGGKTDTGVSKIMQSVCSKLDNKIKSGNINQAQLLGEAQDMMKKLNLFGGGGMPNMADLAAGMASGMNTKGAGSANKNRTVVRRKKSKSGKN